MNCRHLVLLMLAGLWGCGGSDGPEVGRVRGKVTFDGKPVANAQIQFVPKGTGRTSTAQADAEGNFDLLYDSERMGALVGKHTVRVITAVPPQYDDKGKVIKGTGEPEKIPDIYNTFSQIEKTVNSGNNEINLDLAK